MFKKVWSYRYWLCCRNKYSWVETLCGEEKFFCDNCSSKQEAQKRIRIKKLPTTLILHLKRFKYIEQVFFLFVFLSNYFSSYKDIKNFYIVLFFLLNCVFQIQ